TVTVSGIEEAETIVGEKEIELSIENEPPEGCVGGALVYVDETQVYSEKGAPSSFKLNSNDIPQFADGMAHFITVVLFDEENVKISSSKPIFVAFETHKAAKPEDEETKGDVAGGSDGDETAGSSDGKKELSLIEINTMAK